MTKTMTRHEVADLVNKWFDDGTITTASKLGVSFNHIDRLSNKRELSYTTIKSLLFNGDSRTSPNYAELDKLIQEKRVMSPLTARVKKDLRTLYQLQKAAMNGELLRIERDGIILYID